MKLLSLVAFGAIINTAIHTVNSAATYKIETKCNGIPSTCPAITNNVEEVRKCLPDLKNLVRGGGPSCFGLITIDLEFLNQKPIRSTDPNNKDVLYAMTLPKDMRLYINDPDIDEQVPRANFTTQLLATAKLDGFKLIQVQVGKPDPERFFTKDPIPKQLFAKFFPFYEPVVWGLTLDNRESTIRYLSPDDIVLGVVVPAGTPEAEMEAFNVTSTLLYLLPPIVGSTTPAPTVI